MKIPRDQASSSDHDIKAAPRRDVRRLAIVQVSLWHRGHGPAEARRRVRAAAPNWPADALAAALDALDDLDADRAIAPPCVPESPARDALRRILGQGGDVR